MFEQERAADTEVDALQLDKRHPPIVRGRAIAGVSAALESVAESFAALTQCRSRVG
jgi:hypothetical protein